MTETIIDFSAAPITVQEEAVLFSALFYWCGDDQADGGDLDGTGAFGQSHGPTGFPAER
jgi:hypothetical protein